MKPSERIGEISKKYAHWKLEDTTPDYTGIKAQAIIDYLDEQAETTISEGENNCACGEQTTFGDADVEIGGVCHRVKKPCYVIASQKETHLKPTVRSFITFCEAHPELRLFQAIQAWLKENGQHVEYIYLQKPHGPLEDAFYLDNIK